MNIAILVNWSILILALVKQKIANVVQSEPFVACDLVDTGK